MKAKKEKEPNIEDEFDIIGFEKEKKSKDLQFDLNTWNEFLYQFYLYMISKTNPNLLHFMIIISLLNAIPHNSEKASFENAEMKLNSHFTQQMHFLFIAILEKMKILLLMRETSEQRMIAGYFENTLDYKDNLKFSLKDCSIFKFTGNLFVMDEISSAEEAENLPESEESKYIEEAKDSEIKIKSSGMHILSKLNQVICHPQSSNYVLVNKAFLLAQKYSFILFLFYHGFNCFL